MLSSIILCGGNSSRFKSDKILFQIDNQPLIHKSLSAFNESVTDEIIIVSNPADFNILSEIANTLTKPVKVVLGGETRTDSVKCGLSAVDENSKYVAIHDGARPFVSIKLINDLFKEVLVFDSAIPFIKVTDSIFKTENNEIEFLNRDNLISIQTPQVFNTSEITLAYQAIDTAYSDDSQVYYSIYKELHFFEGEATNRKITYRTDIVKNTIGNGYDVHRLELNRPLILGGVTIPYKLGLVGHSDADVLIHAIMDSLLNACNLGDIGNQFPNTDNQYLNISSVTLLKEVNAKIKNIAVIQNISATIIAENPKLSPFINDMKSNICGALQIPLSSLSIACTTTEGLGIVGNNQGIAVYAVANVTTI